MDMIENNLKEIPKKLIKAKEEEDDSIDYEGIDVKPESKIEEIENYVKTKTKPKSEPKLEPKLEPKSEPKSETKYE